MPNQIRTKYVRPGDLLINMYTILQMQKQMIFITMGYGPWPDLFFYKLNC